MKCHIISLFSLVIFANPLVTASAILLTNPQWQIELEPETLAISVTAKDQPTLLVSAGGERKGVANLIATESQATWLWENGTYQVKVGLEERDLTISIEAKAAGYLTLINQPSTALGKGLIFPLAEGYYIPAKNELWRKFLLENLGTVNTTQDMSLPLWSLDRGDYSLSWIFATPYNNQLQFYQGRKNDQSLAMRLNHQFTSIDPSAAMVMILHLGASDPLAGAKRYREWLIKQGLFESFSAKLAMTPAAKKLAGASHVYLWGNDLIAVKDIVDWSMLVKTLQGSSELAGKIRVLFDVEAQKTLVKTKDSMLDRYQKKVLVNAFNDALKSLARASWQTAEPDINLLVNRYGELRQQVAAEFKTSLDENTDSWGSGLSIDTIKQLKQAGITNLWIGLGDGWEGGLWHPAVIAAAVDAGYLIAPYDSYQTALPLDVNPDWTTAHLGDKVYKECAITLENGLLKSGFQQSGHYTTPDCVRPWLEQRITALKEKAGFNSWFLDAYATGMIFDSYNTDNTVSQKQNAEGNIKSMRWVAEVLNIPLGSEDGNAVTSRGLFFAHGMQTPVIGWGDKEMAQPKSPYYVGRWYPNDEPSVFFKSAQLKESLRSIYFDPAHRLPLYQTVFHDSVITTQHWLFDNLKLKNVSLENQLTQLLYNVPPLFNLSQGTLKQRLPHLRHQDEFFKPLHQRLFTQALTDFKWQSEDHLVQETRFSDGTRLLANFSDQQRQVENNQLPAFSILAINPDGTKNRYQAKAA